MVYNFKKNINKSFSALSHKNFRIFWIGQCISLTGTWMQNISQPWLAYTLTKSPFLLSLVGALQFTPMLLFSLFAGVFVDKFPKKRIIIFTQSISAILALIFAVLVLTRTIQFWHILILATLLGFVNTLDMPARQSFMIELVGKNDLMNAIALNSSVFNTARIIGPAIAGFLMGSAGIGFCFLINAISYIPVITGLFLIKNVHQFSNNSNKNILKNIKEGLNYILGDKLIFRTLISVLIIGTFAVNANVLVPVFSKQILKVGETGFGILMSSIGIGSLIGAVFIAIKSKIGPKNQVLVFCSFIIPLVLILIGISNNYFLTAFLLICNGIFVVMFFTTANSTIQLNSKNEYRGRVMSVYSLVFGGSTPIGYLFTGAITDRFGARWGFIITALVTIILISILFVIRKKVDKKEILIENNIAFLENDIPKE